jgi:signal transduction histidine kinase/CheY-like chemotaxis protein
LRAREGAIAEQADKTPAWLPQLRREQVASLYRNGLITIPVTWLAGAVLAMVLVNAGGTSPLVAGVWFALLSAQTIARVALSLAYSSVKPDASAWKLWADWVTGGSILGGLVWGVGTLFLMPPDRFDLQMLVVLIVSALVYGSVVSMALWPPAFYSFFLLAMVPPAIWSLFQQTIEHVAYGLLAGIWIPAVGVVALRFSRNSVNALAVGMENAALAEDLRRQKIVAEDANLAKSRFLASASHDLRQPVHALGLFVGALKQQQLPITATQLVEQIDSAVDAIDKLFIALLDVSRLDAGVVKPDPREVDVRAMLERLAREMAPIADAKGLSLRIHAGPAWVRSDPVLLERVIRNLLSNAIRYTDAGGVLAAVRTAGRKEASIEIWDTGRGIPEAQRELVFQEFYRPETGGHDNAGGLGLGLTIVRRLCGLMGHGLDLRSTEGRGSVFCVRAPVVLAPAPVIRATASAPHAASGARILVIDDDPVIRSAMEALLGAWGYEVATAASGDDALALLARDGRPPAAVLCDYRLGGEDGLTVLRRLQAVLALRTPAALITGDTDPEHLREAAASGLPILHKPLARGPLRALLGNLVRLGQKEPV